LKSILSIAFIIAAFYQAKSQEIDTVQWKKRGEIKIGFEDVWSVDILGNIYSTDDRVINKYDSIGKLKFSQSIKSFGHLKDLQPINPMKVIGFSEEQQIICVLDNTLTLSDECVDLTRFDIGNASLIAVSGQSDKLWVLDQLNSKLLLLSLNHSSQFQEVKNLQGILNMAEILLIKEVNNELFLADAKGKIYQFDVYGSLLSVYEHPGLKDILVKDNNLIILTNNQLILSNMLSNEKKIMNLPMKGVSEVELSGNYFYFRAENKIVKYSLILHK
jgi:hypothetical protein